MCVEILREEKRERDREGVLREREIDNERERHYLILSLSPTNTGNWKQKNTLEYIFCYIQVLRIVWLFFQVSLDKFSFRSCSR